MENKEYGYVEILLNDVIYSKGISKNVLAERANLQRTQLNSYCNNKVKRLDLDVISRLCSALECNVDDILKYHNE